METIVPEGYQETKLGIIPNDWEVKTFQSIFERVTRKNTVNNQNVLTISAQHGLVNQEDFFNKSVSSEDLSGYILLNKGEFAYNKSYSNGYPMGAIKRLKKYDQGVVSSLYIYFKAIKDEPEFYEHYFEAGMLNREIYKIAQEGARNHGLLNMSVIEFFKDLHVAKPPKIEQQKIAQILTTWDEAIVKQEKIIKEKEHLKKGLMQKLLSGEVRFDGFNKKNTIFKLGDLISEVSEKSTKNNQYEVLSSTKEGMFLQSEYFNREIASKDNTGYKILRKYQMVFSPQNLWLGNVNVNMRFDVGIVSPSYKIFDIHTSLVDINYFSYLIKSPRMLWDYMLSSEQGASVVRRNLDMDLYYDIAVHVPNLDEQKKIAEVLSLADDEINLLKNELEELKQQKKALMQKLLTGEVRVKV